jgi:hypothetical protein
VGQTGSLTDEEELAGLARALQQMLLASYGLYPTDLVRELADALGHLGGEDVVLLLSDYDQELLIGFEPDDDRSFRIDDDGPGLAYRHEVVVTEALDGGRQRTWVPAKDSAERLGVLGVVDDGSVSPRSWETVASLVGELIVSKAEYGDHITLRKRTARFALAAEMRWSLLPPLTFTGPDVTIAGFLQPSHGIAGDAFDYAVTYGKAALGIFDAMGHGMEASRMANVAVSSYRNSRRAGFDPAACLTALDHVITEEFGDARFVTAQTAELDLGTGEITVANAGHPQPVLLRRGAPPEPIDCEPTTPAGLHCVPSSLSLQLEAGDGVLFRTDGMVDARSPAGEPFGDDRLVTLLAQLVDEGLPPAEVLRQCVRGVLAHQDGRPGDDATMLLVRWRPDAPVATASDKPTVPRQAPAGERP